FHVLPAPFLILPLSLSPFLILPLSLSLSFSLCSSLRFCFAWPWYSGCPLGSAPVTCPDLCQSARCRGQPGAVCHMITCGSCHTQWGEPDSGKQIESPDCGTCTHQQ